MRTKLLLLAILPVLALSIPAHADCFAQAKKAAANKASIDYPSLQQVFVGTNCRFISVNPASESADDCVLGGMDTKQGNEQFDGSWSVYVVIANIPAGTSGSNAKAVTYTVDYDDKTCEIKAVQATSHSGWESN